MNPFRKFLPDLRTCELEDRLLPAIANVGVIVLTTGGYVPLVPSPRPRVPHWLARRNFVLDDGLRWGIEYPAREHQRHSRTRHDRDARFQRRCWRDDQRQLGSH